MKRFRGSLLVGCLVCGSGCVTPSKKKVVAPPKPAPVATLPLMPEPEPVADKDGAEHHSEKKVTIAVTLMEQSTCTVSFPYNLMRFELISTVEPDTVIKAMEPVKRTFSIAESLEEEESYAARVIYLPQDRELVKKTFVIEGDELNLDLSLPCRSGDGS